MAMMDIAQVIWIRNHMKYENKTFSVNEPPLSNTYLFIIL